MQRFTIHSPLEKALMNAIECLTNKEKDLKACLEDLDWLKEIPLGEYAFEELKKDFVTKKPKVELKYVFLEAHDTKPVVISNELSSVEEEHLVEVFKNY